MPLDAREYELVTDCVSFVDNCPEKLNDFEISFLTGKGPNDQYDSLVEKYEKYGEDMRMSPKQIQVLERMYDKIVNGVDPFGGRR